MNDTGECGRLRGSSAWPARGVTLALVISGLLFLDLGSVAGDADGESIPSSGEDASPRVDDSLLEAVRAVEDRDV